MSHILHPQIQEHVDRPDFPHVTIDLVRFNPIDNETSTMQRYVLPYRRRLSIFTALREIYELQDPSIAFRNQQCGRGICGTCRVRVDLDRLNWVNKSVKGCTIPIEPGDHLVVRPAYQNRVVRDIVVDL